MGKKKILFVTTRSPFSNIFSGDRYRAKQIVKNLEKKHNVDVVYSDNLRSLKTNKGKNFFFKRKFLDRLIKILNCLFSFKPIQLGYFYSSDLDNFLKKNHKNYNTIIFHLIRSAQYLPPDFKGKKILEMTDLISNNYRQVVKSLSFLNPMFYIYYLEKYLVKKYEIYCADKFDKIICVSKNDFKNINIIKNKKKFVGIPNSHKSNKYIYSFKNSNYKILFIGNTKYLPNKNSCYNFAKKILPRINIDYPNIEFHIVGHVEAIDKFLLNRIKNTYCHGAINRLDNIIKNSICGICNLNIATGLQNKILTYISYGLPCVSSELSYKNTFLVRNREILVYKNERHLIDLIKKLKRNKNLSKKISKHSYFALKRKYNEKKIFTVYNKLI